MPRKIGSTSTRPLTPRELECIDLAARGCCVKVIARKLQISDETIKLHLAHVRRFYKVNTTLQAVLKHLGHQID